MFYIKRWTKLRKLRKEKSRMQNIQVNHKWISAQKYARETGLGVEKVKQFIRAKKIEGEQTDDGYWKVKVYDNDAVSREIFEKEHARVIELETIVNSMKSMLEGVKTWN